MKKNHYLMLLASLCSGAMSVNVSANTLSYDFVQMGYVKGDYADIKPFDLTGLEIEGSYSLPHDFFVTGKYRSSDDSHNSVQFDESNWQVGVGYRFDFRSNTVFDARVTYGDIRFELIDDEESANASTNYYSVAGNVRHQLTDSVEVYGGLEWQFWDEGSDQKAYRLGARYSFKSANAFSLGIEYTKYSDSQWGKLFARYQF